VGEGRGGWVGGERSRNKEYIRNMPGSCMESFIDLKQKYDWETNIQITI